MKNRILVMLMCLILVSGILPVSALAVDVIDSGSCGDGLTWTLDKNYVLTISGKGPMADLFSEAPNVADIAWNKYRSDIKNVVVEEGVTSISDNSFRNCVNITEVSISSSVSDIGDYAFEDCKALQRFIVDEDNNSYCNDKIGLLYTKDMQLLKCVPYTIEEMVLPEAVLEIAYDAFSDGDFENVIKCTGDAITYYGTTMFGNTIYYPEDNPTWTEAIKGAFGSNIWITYIPDEAVVMASGEYGDNLTWTLDIDGTLTISGEGPMASLIEGDPYTDSIAWCKYRSDVRTVVVEEGVTSICSGAFSFCSNLTSISIPASVTEISMDEGVGVDAIYPCSSLEKVIVDEDNQNYSSDEYGVLFNKDKTELYMAPVSCKLGDYAIPDGVINIASFSFWSCQNITEVRIPKSVEEVGYYAFGGCDSLQKFVVDDDNKYYCSDEIGLLYSKDMGTLECVPIAIASTIVIPASVKDIEWDAFSDGDFNNVIKFEGNPPNYDAGFSLPTTIYYPANNPTWTDDVFEVYGGDNITWIAYGDHLRGDINSDGRVSNSDLVILARYVLDVYESDSDMAVAVEKYGDLNEDGRISNSDLVILARINLGMI